jgi:hypothetical protein
LLGRQKMTKITKKNLLSSILLGSVLTFSYNISYADQELKKATEDKTETLFPGTNLSLRETVKSVGGQVKDAVKDKASEIKDKAKEKGHELSAKAKEVATAVRENAPWSDIIKKVAKTGLKGLGGCAKGTIVSLPAALAMGIPSMGVGTALDLGGACVMGAAKSAGPAALKLVYDSIKTTADLIKIDTEIKTNEADIRLLQETISDANAFLLENPDLDANTVSKIREAIANTTTLVGQVQTYIAALKVNYAEAQKAFKEKKL